MLKGIKNKLKNLILPNENSMQTGFDEMRFPGGISPISETSKDDVFIVGFPKSGNTLMQHIIAHLVYGINEAGSRTMVNLIVPDIYANSHYFRMNTTCYFKSHELPKSEYKKVIYIIRDGREALLSFYHMRKNMGHEVSLKELYTGQTKIFNTTWKEHIQAWEENPFKSEILWITFEDLIKNKLHELNRICSFLNIKRDDNEMKKVIEFTSLGHMKSLEERSDWKRMKSVNFINNNTFIRKGKLDSYKNEITPELLDLFTEDNKKLLNKYYNETT